MKNEKMQCRGSNRKRKEEQIKQKRIREPKDTNTLDYKQKSPNQLQQCTLIDCHSNNSDSIRNIITREAPVGLYNYIELFHEQCQLFLCPFIFYFSHRFVFALVDCNILMRV